ncbi:hypothetical protein ACFL7M_07460 [Thermodesulfobacteriota bacterium]
MVRNWKNGRKVKVMTLKGEKFAGLGFYVEKLALKLGPGLNVGTYALISLDNLALRISTLKTIA